MVDINKPITNPGLAAAILRLKNENTTEAKDNVLLELNRSNFLAIIFADEMHTSEPDESGRAVVEKDSVIKVLNTSDGQGNMYLPLFTDWDAIREYTDQPISTLVLPSQDAWHWVLNMGEYHGAVINPGGDALPLNRGQVKYLAATGGGQS